MKILAISLLRIGDLVLQRPLMEALRKKHPEAEVHLLLNKQFAQAEFLFAGLVDKFIYFDRDVLQKSCGEKEYNIFWGLNYLKNFIGEMNQTSYDTIYNFTHNKLTAHISGLLNAQQRIGIFSDDGRFFGLSNPWIQFFNQYFGAPEAAGFHYTELLARSMEITLKTEPARRFAGARARKRILIQPLTSDAKKNWSLASYAEVLHRLEKSAAYEVSILAAPFEAEQLKKVFSEDKILVCSFEEASRLLADCDLLVTGDTSIKHLAALQDVPILELSLGSSQPLQVGAYANNSVILQSRVACGPCPHSSPCSQATHLCGQRLEAAAVVEAAENLLGTARPNWALFAEKYPELNIFKTEIQAILGWTVHCFSLGIKNVFDEVIQKKMMIVEQLDRRQATMTKGVSHEQRLRKLPDGSPQAS